MIEAYTLTQADVDGCRRILDRLEAIEAKTGGGYTPGSTQAYTQSATSTVRFEHKTDAFTTAEAMDQILNAAPTLGLLCRKVVAHCETHPEAVTDA